MSVEKYPTIRYSDADLAAFRIHIEQLKEKALEQKEETLGCEIEIQYLECETDRFDDWSGDDTAWDDLRADLESFHPEVKRIKRYIQELDNALLRIENKSYGICTVTAKLIDKKLLLVIPTVTKIPEEKDSSSPTLKNGK